MKPKTAGRKHGGCRDAGPIHAVSTADSIPCDTALTGLCADARVVTMRGIRRVQDLRPGDRLVTRGHGAVPLLRVDRQSFVTRAVYVIAGSLGHHQPDRDTLLPAAQTVHVRDWRARFFGRADNMIVCARDLVDGEYVRDIGFMPLTVYRIHCPSPAVIYADGMELGTAGTSAVAIRSALPA